MTSTPLTITAAATAVDTRTRTITGRIVPFGEVGFTSAGPTRFLSNSIRIPADVGRVKLLTQHDDRSPAVGIGSAFAIAADGISMSFHVPPGPEGDEALRLAGSGQRDGLSVGVAVFDSAAVDGVVDVLDAELTEVSLVTIPAFRSATVLEIAAQKGNTMTDTTPAPAPDTTPDTVEASAAPVTVLNAAAPAVPEPVSPPAARAIIPPRPGAAAPQTVRAAAAITLAHLRDGNPPSMLSAALADLIPADDVGQGLVSRPQWVGELWTHSRTARPVIDAIRRGVLTGLSVVGWTWDPANRPVVADYAGDKTAIASNKVKTLAVTANAQRYAWGLDIDRAYIDLGAPGMIEDVFSQAVDSYRNVTEADVAGALVTAATALTATDLPAWLNEAAAAAVGLGSSLDFVVVATDVFSAFSALGPDDVPWWLRNGNGGVSLPGQSGNAGGVSFAVDPTLPAGTILGGDSRAATWYEVNPPIRVRAENIPNGGVDIGVFGYGALIVNDAAALFKNGATPPIGLAAKSTK